MSNAGNSTDQPPTVPYPIVPADTSARDLKLNRLVALKMVLAGGLLFACIFLQSRDAQAQPASDVWKAGVAKLVITPTENLWMAGYAARKKPAEGKAQELYAKALALEDASGKRVVLVTMDLIGITRSMREAVEKKVRDRHKLLPESLLLNASHTHCGPVVRSGGSVLYDLNAAQVKGIADYVAGLEEKLVDLVGDALKNLSPARLGYSHARAGFAMNRRLPTAKGYQNSPYPEGPVDHEVPVLRIDSADGKLRAVLFGYACHNTTLSFYEYCGDYAGYAQEYLEQAQPGTVALFLTGCGGDQNPYPRGTLENAKQHGRALANAVEAALLPKPRPVAGPVRSVLETVTLDFVPMSREELIKLKMSTTVADQKRAQHFLDQLDKTGKIHATYSYPIQAIQFGKDLTLVGLAGETVVDYSLRLKKELGGAGAAVWVAGYCNDVFGYVPTVRVLKEGGYEGGGAMRLTLLPGPFAPSVEERLVGKVNELTKRVRTANP
ncbi:MAG: neutral/alkaline non-lysosomal ceramidase N-terminal domain-containing protein [Gemmataceae bacterium]|nr:neutral/alkaline non-lysosomal ceramidase N-terminal domain-containing protein [Gemmataceae bacterium]